MITISDRLQIKKDVKLDAHFASIGFTFLLYMPGAIALATAFLFIATGLFDAASPCLIMASLITLLSGSIDTCRRKIIRQDQAIRVMQEKIGK